AGGGAGRPGWDPDVLRSGLLGRRGAQGQHDELPPRRSDSNHGRHPDGLPQRVDQRGSGHRPVRADGGRRDPRATGLERDEPDRGRHGGPAGPQHGTGRQPASAHPARVRGDGRGGGEDVVHPAFADRRWFGLHVTLWLVGGLGIATVSRNAFGFAWPAALVFGIPLGLVGGPIALSAWYVLAAV